MPEPAKIRNVAVVGHRGTGKTSLVEALLFQTGKINRLGTVEAGTTVSDADEDEHKRQLSISMSLEHTEWQDRKVNLIDVPGDPAFQGELRCAARVVEGALVTVSAVMGVEVGTSARVAARGRARPRARRVRQHARPRARRLLPHARGAPQPALHEVRRSACPDRRRARAHRDRRRPAHVRLLEPRGREGRRARARSRTSWQTSPPSTARSCSTPSSRPTRRSWSATSTGRSSTQARSRQR